MPCIFKHKEGSHVNIKILQILQTKKKQKLNFTCPRFLVRFNKVCLGSCFMLLHTLLFFFPIFIFFVALTCILRGLLSSSFPAISTFFLHHLSSETFINGFTSLFCVVYHQECWFSFLHRSNSCAVSNPFFDAPSNNILHPRNKTIVFSIHL